MSRLIVRVILCLLAGAIFFYMAPSYSQEESSIQIEFVNIKSVLPDIEVDLKYATPDNFTGATIYEFSECYVLKPVAEKLALVQEELKLSGIGLKISDGFRPLKAQWKLWELIPDERYVSDPKKGGRHTRGTAVDATLITKEGIPLLMPTDFDDFSEKAHRDYQGAPKEAIHNRALLQSVMQRHGFIGLSTEWWHFDWIGWQECPPLDEVPAK